MSYFSHHRRRRATKATEAERSMMDSVRSSLSDARWADYHQRVASIDDLDTADQIQPPQTLVSENDRQYQLINRWRQASVDVLGTVASVVAGQTVDAEWVDSSVTDIACTDGETIKYSTGWFLDHLLPALTGTGSTKDLAMAYAELKGVTLHELCHVLYTPRRSAKPTCDMPADLRFAYNVLEDQRIESLFTARYRPSIPFFRYIVLKHIASQMTDPERNWSIYFLLAGRKYIDADTRKAARDACVARLGENVASEIDRIVGRYRYLIFPADAAEAMDLCQQLHDLLSAQTTHIPNPTPGNESSTVDQHDHKAGRPAPVPEQRQDQQAMQEMDEELDNPAGGDADSDSDGDADGEDGAAKGSDGDDNADAGTPADILQDAIKAALNESRPHMQREGDSLHKSVSRTIKRVEGTDLVPRVNDTVGIRYESVQPWMRRTVSTIIDGFMRVQADSEPEYHRDQAFGSLNPEAVMVSRKAHFDVFDQYDEGNEDGLSFEVVILVDRSTSMHYGPGSDTEQAYQALWILQRACQTIGIPVTVLGYSDHGSMVATSTTPVRADRYSVLPTIGGTSPDQALQWASTIVKGSQQIHRLVFTITDGQWAYGYANDPVKEATDEIRANGGKTVLLTVGNFDGINYTGESIFQHGKYYGHDDLIICGHDTRSVGKKVCDYLLRLSAESLSSVN